MLAKGIPVGLIAIQTTDAFFSPDADSGIQAPTTHSLRCWTATSLAQP